MHRDDPDQKPGHGRRAAPQIRMIKAATVETAYEVFSNIPELDRYLSLAEFTARTPDSALILIYEDAGNPVAFKIGYPLDQETFYSWLGGVLPGYRHRGIARKLLEYQETHVIERGFRQLSVKSMNRYPSMIRLLVKNRYKIEKVENFDSDAERIHFLKTLD